MDPFFEILKNTTIKSLRQFSMTNKKINEICHDRYFWIEKFKHDNLPLFSEPNDYNGWIKEYNKMYDMRKTANKILIINNIERKRVDYEWQSEGTIEILNNDKVNITNFFNEKKIEIDEFTKNLKVNSKDYVEDFFIYLEDDNYFLHYINHQFCDDGEIQYEVQQIKIKNEIIMILIHLIYHKCKIQDINFNEGIPFLIAGQEPPTHYSENEKLWFNRRVGMWEALDYLID
jgi:hypothetical protein